MDPTAVDVSTIGQAKILRSISTGVRERTLKYCLEVKQSIVKNIVLPSVEMSLGKYPDLKTLVAGYLTGDSNSLWERQFALARAEISALISAQNYLFNEAVDVTSVLAQLLGEVKPSPPLYYRICAFLRLGVRNLKGFVASLPPVCALSVPDSDTFRILWMRLIVEPILILERSCEVDRTGTSGSEDNALTSGDLCVWQLHIFGVSSKSVRVWESSCSFF